MEDRAPPALARLVSPAKAQSSPCTSRLFPGVASANLRAMRLFLIALFSLGFLSQAHAEKRAWTSLDGKSSFEGELMEYNATEVRLKRSADFKTFILPLEKLSAEDQAFVKNLLREDARRSRGAACGRYTPDSVRCAMARSSGGGHDRRVPVTADRAHTGTQFATISGGCFSCLSPMCFSR